MDPIREQIDLMTRRHFFGRTAGIGLGSVALASLLAETGLAAGNRRRGSSPRPGTVDRGPARPAAFPAQGQAGHLSVHERRSVADGPAGLQAQDGRLFDKDLPDSIRKGQRLTTMTSGQARFPVAPSKYKFARHGKSGMWVSELLPWTARIVDEISLIKTVWTEAINHDPAVTYICTGHQLPGRASLGSWLSYGLGTMNQNLPAFVVMTASWTSTKAAQAIYNRLWGPASCPASTREWPCARRATRCSTCPTPRASTPPPAGARSTPSTASTTASTSDRRPGDPGPHRPVRDGLPHADLGPRADRHLQRAEAHPRDVRARRAQAGHFARCCLLARRLAERDVRFVQIFHRGWDQHGNLAGDLPASAATSIRPPTPSSPTSSSAGCSTTRWSSGAASSAARSIARASSPATTTAATTTPSASPSGSPAAGIKKGVVYGETDDFSYNVVEEPGAHPRPERHDPALPGHRPPPL